MEGRERCSGASIRNASTLLASFAQGRFAQFHGCHHVPPFPVDVCLLLARMGYESGPYRHFISKLQGLSDFDKLTNLAIIHADRRHYPFTARLQEIHPRRIAGERLNSGRFHMAPDGLPSLACVDLTRELRGWKTTGYSLCRFGFDLTASVAFEQALRAKRLRVVYFLPWRIPLNTSHQIKSRL